MLSKLVEAKENQMKTLAKYSDFVESASAVEMEKRMHQVANDQAEHVCESYEDLEYVQVKTAKLLKKLTAKIESVQENMSMMRAKVDTLFPCDLKFNIENHLLDSDDQLFALN
jgi:esterase/lipase